MQTASEAQMRNMFPDVDFGEAQPIPTPAPPVLTTTPVTTSVPQPAPTPTQEAKNETAAQTQGQGQAQTQEGLQVEGQAPPVTPPAAPTPVEEVEVDEGEYTHFKEVIAADPDGFIAKYVSQRKATGTVQSQRDKLLNAVGKTFAEAAYKGDVAPEMQRLFSDLFHPEMQQHLKKFYESHELRDGKYIQTKPDVPPAAVLQKFVDLTAEKANLSAVNGPIKESNIYSHYAPQ